MVNTVTYLAHRIVEYHPISQKIKIKMTLLHLTKNLDFTIIIIQMKEKRKLLPF